MSVMLLLKASLLLSLTLGAARLLGRAPALVRHRLWTLAFAAVLALPLLAVVMPVLYVPVPAGWPSTVTRVGTAVATARVDANRVDADRTRTTRVDDRGEARDTAQATTMTDDARASVPVASSGPPDWRAILRWPALSALLAIVWLTGAAVAAAAHVLSLCRARRLTHAAEEVDDPAWRTAADALGGRLGMRHPARLLLSDAVGTPMAGGLWRPTIFLPASARTWSSEQRDVVLAHEMAHLAGCDPLRHVVARLAFACYWFHPLAWMAARQAMVAREQACDEAVLALGTRPSDYARVLLEMASSMRPAAAALGALPMIEPSLLEKRLMTILSDDPRPAGRRGVPVPATAVVLLTLALAALQPVVSASLPDVPAAREASTAAPVPAAPATETPSEPKALPETRAAAPAQTAIGSDSACWWDFSGPFSGSVWTSNVDGRRIVNEQIGSRGRDRVIQQRFGDLHVCMVAEDAGDRERDERPSQWPGRARRAVLEARRGSTVQRLEIVPEAAGALRVSWHVNGAERAFDAAAQRWRDRMLATLDASWELAVLRGQVSSLRGEISSIRGEESSLRGEISSLRGEVSSMRGRISSIRGEESSLRGQISSINGHVSSLRGAISSEQGAISGLQASRYGANDAERSQIAASIQRHDAQIARIEREIREYDAAAKISAVEREITALKTDAKVAAIEAEIQAFDVNAKVAAVERQIAALDVSGKVAAIERQIEALDADRRSRQLEARRDAELKELEAAVAAIR